jgi:hypothetical protein
MEPTLPPYRTNGVEGKVVSTRFEISCPDSGYVDDFFNGKHVDTPAGSDLVGNLINENITKAEQLRT